MSQQQPFDFETLLDYVEGRLSAEQAAAVAAWLESAPTANADAAWLRAFLDLSEQVALPRLSQARRDALTARFEARRPAPDSEEEPSLWQRIIASLIFDSHLGQPAAVLRSAAAAERQVLFGTPPLNVAIDIARRDRGYTLSGQLLANADQSDLTAEVQLIDAANGPVATAASSAFGAFTFDAVSPGLYRLHIRYDAVEIEVEPLELA